MENNQNSKRLEPHVFTAMTLYLKYRYSHKVGGEFLKIRKKLLTQLRAATPEKREDFVAAVDQFLENTKNAEMNFRRQEEKNNAAALERNLKEAKQILH